MLFQWLKDQCSFLEVRRESGDSMHVFLVGTERCVSADKKTGRASSPLSYLFIAPHPVLWVDEKRICCVSRLSADLPPEAHLHKAELAFANGMPACGREPQCPILKKGSGSHGLTSAYSRDALAVLSVTWQASVQDGVSLWIPVVRMGRENSHGVVEALRRRCGDIWWNQEHRSWLNRTLRWTS